MMIYRSTDNGAAIGAFGPVAAQVYEDVFVNMTTLYPYDDVITVTVTAGRELPFYMRVPAWATSATITVNGQAQPVTAGAMNDVTRLVSWFVVADLNLRFLVCALSWGHYSPARSQA
jgi:DUF1680 family protein